MHIVNKILIPHPFIFSVIPVFYLYSRNFYEYPLIVIVKPTLIMLAVTSVSLILLNRIFKDKYKSASIFSLFILMFFMFGPFYAVLYSDGESPRILRFRYFLSLYFFLFTIMLIFFVRKRMDYNKVSNFFNLSGFIILGLLSFWIVSPLFFSRNDLHRAEKEQKIISEFKKQFNISKKDNYFPNIYYIILDSYPSYENMSYILGFENKDFKNYLMDKGFFIAKDSRSNYNYTHLSVSATLDMDYLPMERAENHSFKLKKDRFNLKEIEKSSALSYFKSLGYNVFITSPLLNTQYNEIEFLNSLLMMTVLISPYLQNYISALLFRDHNLFILNSLEKTVNLKEPFFVYGHIMIPHIPYMFDRFGNMPGFFKQHDVEAMFVDQLLYTNERVKKIIDNFLSASVKRPIIIIQGDHGPDLIIKDKERRMMMRTGILNAIFLPDGRENIFYDGMTSVNTFRILFNKYFGTNFEILPDVTYYQEKERGSFVIYRPKGRD